MADAPLRGASDLRPDVTDAAVLGADVPPGDLHEQSWGGLPRPPPRNDAPILSAEGFEGPLDWLLEMARAHRIDLAKLPIAALIQSFVDALEAALARPDGQPPVLSRWGEWLVMAATLTQLRSRLLLPADAAEAKAALSDAEALRRQLVGREEMRAAADWLERRPQLGREVFARSRPEGHAARRGGDVTDLLRACLKLLQAPEQMAAVYRPRPPPFWRVSQAMARIEGLLAERADGASLVAFLPAVGADVVDRDRRCRAAVASTLVAGLELARQGRVWLGQEGEWGDISLGLVRPDSLP